jgi:hypothetical protein
MSSMSKNNGTASPREGTASAVREAARAGDPESVTSPERPKRRTFTAEYKLRVVREADAALASGVEGAVGPGPRERCPATNACAGSRCSTASRSCVRSASFADCAPSGARTRNARA